MASSTNADVKTIRGDKITWVKGTESHCQSIGSLINQVSISLRSPSKSVYTHESHCLTRESNNNNESGRYSCARHWLRPIQAQRFRFIVRVICARHCRMPTWLHSSSRLENSILFAIWFFPAIIDCFFLVRCWDKRNVLFQRNHLMKITHQLKHCFRATLIQFLFSFFSFYKYLHRAPDWHRSE